MSAVLVEAPATPNSPDEGALPACPSPQPTASTLRCPDSPLGRARSGRGWSQAKAVRVLVLTARHWGWRIASESSLHVLLSEWENGKRRPGESYRVLLCALYQATPEQLGFTPERTQQRGTARSTAPTDGQCPELTRELEERVASLEELVVRLADRLAAATGGEA